MEKKKRDLFERRIGPRVNLKEGERSSEFFDNWLAKTPSKIGSEETSGYSLFENLPELMRAELAASVLGVSIKTIYDWRYRSKQRKIPQELFVKVNRSLLIRTNILRQWIASQNPALKAQEKE